MKDGSLSIHSLASCNCFTYWSLFQNDANDMSKLLTWSATFCLKDPNLCNFKIFWCCSNFTSLWKTFVLRGYCTPGPYFWRICAFSQNIKQLRTKYPMDLVRNVPRNSKITVLLQWRPLLWSYSQKCAKINIFHVLNHKSITTWVSEIPMQ